MHTSTCSAASATRASSARVGTTATSWARSRAGAGKARMRSRIRSCTAPGTGWLCAFNSSVTSKGVAPGEPVDRLAVPTGPARLLVDALRGEGLDRHAADDRVGERRQDAAKRMIRSHLVAAVGDEQQRRQPTDPAAEEGQPVQRRLVSPVRVLDHHHLPGSAWPTDQRVEERREDLLLGRGRSQLGGQPATQLVADVVQWSEGPRRDQAVTGSPEHAHPRSAAPGELADQRRLADPRLAGDQRNTTAVGTLPQEVDPGGSARRSVPTAPCLNRRATGPPPVLFCRSAPPPDASGAGLLRPNPQFDILQPYDFRHGSQTSQVRSCGLREAPSGHFATGDG